MNRKDVSRTSRNVLEIIKKDAKAATSNPIVIFVLLALIILPSLYALLNIQACWDPYENTGNLTFAIANLDEGSSYEGATINVGNDLITDLKNNTDFDWTYVSEQDLREGVRNGTYYAGIVINKNFSNQVVSITSDDPHSATLEYIVNDKSNPVASKISDSGAKAIYNQMNAKIVQFINLAAYGKLGELQSSLASGAGQMSSGAVQLSSGATQVKSGAGAVSSGASQLSSGASELSGGASQLSSGASQLSDGALQVSQASDQVSQGSSQVQEASSQLQSSVDVDSLPEGQVKQVVQGSIDLANASSQVAQGSGQVAQGSSQIANKSIELSAGATTLANGANSLADGANTLAEGSLSLAAGSTLLANSAATALYTAASSLSGASNSLSDVTGVDEDQIGDYFYAPVKLEKTKLFESPNYASEVSPFYIVLSMWVGAVITVVMIKPGISEGTKYTPVEMYFGKLLIFVLMAIFQATVTIAGVFIMGLKVANVPMFIFSAYFVSVLFMIIMYSLVSALGQVGKGIGVLLLVLQISSTGGIYPIELMDDFFRVLYPFMPMTHAITIVRESLLGLIWSNYIPSFLILAVLGIVVIILFSIIKQRADKVSHYFEERLKESGLF